MDNIKQQRRQIYAEIDRLNDRSSNGEDVTAELREAGKRLDNLGKSKHRVDVMDIEKVEVKKKPVKKQAAIKSKPKQKLSDDEIARKARFAERKKWAAIARRNGIKYKTFAGRIDNGVGYEKAATTPVGHLRKRSPWVDVAEKNGLTYSTYHERRKRGYTEYDAATIPWGGHRKKIHEMRMTK